MKPPLPLPRAFRKTGSRSINRAPSPALALVTPWLVVMAGSLVPLLPLVASSPVVPPLGFLMLLAWLQTRPHVFPPWAGFPLGLFDDLFSGQPMGSAALLWSFAVLGLDLLEFRLPWRSFAQNWLIAAGLVAGYLLLCAVFAGTALSGASVQAMLPQLAFSILIVPLTGRIAALFDRFRLTPIRDIS